MKKIILVITLFCGLGVDGNLFPVSTGGEYWLVAEQYLQDHLGLLDWAKATIESQGSNFFNCLLEDMKVFFRPEIKLF